MSSLCGAPETNGSPARCRDPPASRFSNAVNRAALRQMPSVPFLELTLIAETRGTFRTHRHPFPGDCLRVAPGNSSDPLAELRLCFLASPPFLFAHIWHLGLPLDFPLDSLGEPNYKFHS
jgi:hypothetical protein